MITKENLCKVAEELYENITVNFVEDNNNPYWCIECIDPDEYDEDIIVAKLYYNTFDLEIKANTMIADSILELVMIFGEDEDSLREKDPKEFLKWIIDTIIQEIEECISYNQCIVDNLN